MYQIFFKKASYSRDIKLYSKYQFSSEYIGEGIQLESSNTSAKLMQDIDRRMVLISPPHYGGGGVTREIMIKLKIKVG